jgi:hypothetical protein
MLLKVAKIYGSKKINNKESIMKTSTAVKRIKKQMSILKGAKA